MTSYHWACCCQALEQWNVLIFQHSIESKYEMSGAVQFFQELNAAYGNDGLVTLAYDANLAAIDLAPYQLILWNLCNTNVAGREKLNTWVRGGLNRRLVLAGEWYSSSSGAGFGAENAWLNTLASALGRVTRFPTTGDTSKGYDDSVQSTLPPEVHATTPYISDYLTDGVTVLARDAVSTLRQWWNSDEGVPLFLVAQTYLDDPSHVGAFVVVEDYENVAGGYVGGSVVFICDCTTLWAKDVTSFRDTDFGITYDPGLEKNLRFGYNLCTRFRYAGGPRSW